MIYKRRMLTAINRATYFIFQKSRVPTAQSREPRSDFRIRLDLADFMKKKCHSNVRHSSVISLLS